MANINLDLAYKYGASQALSFIKKASLLDKDALITAGVGYLSPTLSGLTAESGKGLQTSAAGLGANLLTKAIFKNPYLARAAGALGSTIGSKWGHGLVSPDPQVIQGMRDRGEFSAWDAGVRTAKGLVRGAAFGASIAAMGGIPALAASGWSAVPGVAGAAATSAGTGAARGAFTGGVVAPMVGNIMREVNKPKVKNTQVGQYLNRPLPQRVMREI